MNEQPISREKLEEYIMYLRPHAKEVCSCVHHDEDFEREYELATALLAADDALKQIAEVNVFDRESAANMAGFARAAMLQRETDDAT